MEGFEEVVEESALRNICGACLLDIDASAGKHEVLAMLDCCRPKHIFHPMCIHTWSARENSCPLCKQRFHKYATYGGDGHLLRVQPVEERCQRYCPVESDFVEEAVDVVDEDAPPVWDFCPLCCSAEDEASLLLCDGKQQRCPAMYHFYCLGLTCIPEGDWFCPSCHADMRAEAAGETLARIAEEDFIPMSDSDSSWSAPSTEAGRVSEESEAGHDEDEEEEDNDNDDECRNDLCEPSSSSTSRAGMEPGIDPGVMPAPPTRRRLRPVTAVPGHELVETKVDANITCVKTARPSSPRPRGQRLREPQPKKRQKKKDRLWFDESEGGRQKPRRNPKAEPQRTRKQTDEPEGWSSRLRARRHPANGHPPVSAEAAEAAEDDAVPNALRGGRIRRLERRQCQDLQACQLTKRPPRAAPRKDRQDRPTGRRAAANVQAEHHHPPNHRKIEGNMVKTRRGIKVNDDGDAVGMLKPPLKRRRLRRAMRKVCQQGTQNPFSWAERLKAAEEVCIDLTLAQGGKQCSAAARMSQEAVRFHDEDAPLKTLIRKRSEGSVPSMRSRLASGGGSSSSRSSGSGSGSGSSDDGYSSYSSSASGVFSTESSDGEDRRAAAAAAPAAVAAAQGAGPSVTGNRSDATPKTNPSSRSSGRSEQKAVKPWPPPGSDRAPQDSGTVISSESKAVVDELLRILDRIVTGRLAAIGTEISKRSFPGLSPSERDLRVACLQQRIGALAASKYKPGFERDTLAWVRTLNSPKGEVRIGNFVDRQVAEAMKRWETQAEKTSDAS